MAELYEDLLKDSSESFEDGNYFLLTITELELGTTYPLEFRWKYKDGTYGKDWSAVYNITTPVSSVPGDPNLAAGDVVGGPGYIKVTWNGNDSSGNPIENIDRVNVHIAGTSFGDGTKPAGFFKTAGTQTFTAEPGIYIVQLKAVRVDGATSFFSTARTITVTAIEEAIETPVVPNGFTARAILSGIEVSWAGTYVGGATWSGFQAINIYAGTTSSATGGTYIKVGQMTANKVSNKIVIPIDGTYVRYGFPAYIHASSVNKATPPVESSISANVASATPSQVVNTDLIDAVISEAKIALEAVTALKIAPNAVTETKIADNSISSPKITANAITSDKIETNAITAGKIVAGAITTAKLDALAITSDKIATNAITAGKIDTNAITADLINSGTLKATTYIRVGTKNLSTGAGGRIEISSALIEDGAYDIPAGLYIYNSAGTAVLEAPLGGGLTINGGGTFSGNLSAAGGTFTGTLSAASGSFSGTITASGGTIGGIIIAADAIQNGATSGASTFRLDSSGKARFGASGGNSIIIDPSIGIFQSTNGTSANGNFTLNATGSSTISGWTIGSSSISKGTTILSSSGTNGIIQIGSGTSFFKASSDGLQLGNETFGSAPFRVTPAGALTATSATITGTITSTSGNIGGFLIGSTYLSTDNDLGSASAWFWNSSSGLFRTDQINISKSSGSAGLNMINGSDINMFGGTINLGTSGGSINMGTLGTITGSSSSSISVPTLTATSSLNANASFYIGNATTDEFSQTNGIYGGSGGQFNIRRSSDTPLYVHRYGGSGTRRLLTFILSGSGAGGINADGVNAPQFANPSDYRLKENIEDYFGAINIIKKSRLRKFNFKNNPEKNLVGFIAHEYAEVDPSFVIGEKDAVDENGNPIYQEMMMGSITPYLIGALKESILKIEQLEARLDALEG